MSNQIQHTQNENVQLVASILDIGEMLLMSGAEVSRVEDTMERLGSAYHFNRVDIFTITSSIVFTVQTDSGEIITQTRRIKSTKVNMEKLEQINTRSREICKEPVSLEQLQQYISEIHNTREYNKYIKLFAFPVISGAFTLFYGGTISDAVASMLTGILLYIGLFTGNKIHIQTIVLNMLCSFFTGMFALALIKLGIGASFDKIIIGNIMLLIPGISLTTSLRDMIKGDLISGLLGLCEALLKAFAIAVGFAMVMII